MIIPASLGIPEHVSIGSLLGLCLSCLAAVPSAYQVGNLIVTSGTSLRHFANPKPGDDDVEQHMLMMCLSC